jgi:hypothetical protein
MSTHLLYCCQESDTRESGDHSNGPSTAAAAQDARTLYHDLDLRSSHWLKRYGVTNAFGAVHSSVTGDVGCPDQVSQRVPGLGILGARTLKSPCAPLLSDSGARSRHPLSRSSWGNVAYSPAEIHREGAPVAFNKCACTEKQ